jgi:hypothetical protein
MLNSSPLSRKPLRLIVNRVPRSMSLAPPIRRPRPVPLARRRRRRRRYRVSGAPDAPKVVGDRPRMPITSCATTLPPLPVRPPRLPPRAPSPRAGLNVVSPLLQGIQLNNQEKYVYRRELLFFCGPGNPTIPGSEDSFFGSKQQSQGPHSCAVQETSVPAGSWRRIATGTREFSQAICDGNCV